MRIKYIKNRAGNIGEVQAYFPEKNSEKIASYFVLDNTLNISTTDAVYLYKDTEHFYSDEDSEYDVVEYLTGKTHPELYI